MKQLLLVNLRKVSIFLLAVALAVPTEAQQLFKGDGSNEAGFVPPPPRKETPPPPANMAGGETLIPYPPPPAAPVSRSEKKQPPKPPTVFTKLTSPYGEQDWNARPNDLNNLLKSLKSMADVDYDFDAKSFDEIDTDPDKNPILYRSGHYHFALNEAERKRLRDYLIKGGTLILNAGMGSKPFYDSAIQVMNEVFPEAPVQHLSPDHPIFHSYYQLDKVAYRPGVRKVYQGTAPWLDGVTYDCRTMVIISRFGMEVGWDPLDDDNILAYTPDSAQKLGMNIVTYATAMRTWAADNVRKTTFSDTKQTTAAGAMTLAQVIYGKNGEWKTRHAGLSSLLQQYNRMTGVPVKFATKELKLTDPAIFDCPVLYMTGHETFKLSPEEVKAVGTYLQNGGLLIAEACCGRKAFDAAFREMIHEALPNGSFNVMKSGHPIYRTPNAISTMRVTDACAQAFNASTKQIPPQVLTLDVNGQTAVLYSPIGMLGAWELSPNIFSNSYLSDDAIKLGVNILLYAMTR